MPVRVLWFRRDLRLGDHPAIAAAHGALDEGDPAPPDVVPLFVIDPRLWSASGDVRRAYLLDSLAALDRSLRGRLHVRSGDPVDVVPAVARAAGADEVHVTADFGPYGAQRDTSVQRALAVAGVALVRTGSPYAVAPGRVTKPDGSAYRVFTPFSRAWADHGWRAPLATLPRHRWVELGDATRWPERPGLAGLRLPTAGEDAALARWTSFRDGALAGYAAHRDRADLDATSMMSTPLRWGEIHPRTLLADLDGSKAHAKFRNEVAWREFYADVLHREPASARRSLRPEMRAMEVDSGGEADDRFVAWCEGRTGYPFVDAGMRQLRGEGWVHNRVRMVVASFLVKDLHLDWTRGAREFMRWLRDGDLASNQHGWQWVAGTGTDAAPYFRVFNPVLQGLKFDPDGDYVRRWVPELRGVAGPAVHEPWKLESGLAASVAEIRTRYPERVVLHDEERKESLRRYSSL